MNETLQPGSLSDVPWPTSDHRLQPPAPPTPPTMATGLLDQAVQGAHDTIDRLADSAAPAARQLGESVASAEAALHAKASQLRQTRDRWRDSLRTTVRRNPLACMAAALALGAVLARVTR